MTRSLQPKRTKSIFSSVVLPFATYLFTFVGMGLVAGSVVHFGETDQIPRFLTIGFVGMVMFILSSYVQETTPVKVGDLSGIAWHSSG